MTVSMGHGYLRAAALAAGILVIVLLLPHGSTAADFGQDIQINNNANKQEYPAALVGPNGYIFVIWQDDRNNPGSSYDIYFARSTDNGSTFSTPVRVDDSAGNTDQAYPQLAVDSNGKLHAVWSDYRSGVNYRIYYANSTDNGTTWSPNVMVNYSASGGQYVPSMAIDASNNIYIVWDDGRSGTHVYFAKSTNGGSSFTAASKMDGSSGSARYPWICHSPNGNISVVWQDSRNGNWDVFMVASKDGGASFSSEVNATKNTTSSSQMWPRVASDSSSDLHIVWDDNRNGNFGVYYGYSSDGQTFSTVAVNDTDTGISANPPEPPSLAVDSSGVVHAVWQDKRGGSAYTRIYYAGSTGLNSFGTNARVDNTSTANCYYPFVTVDSNNVPGVVWEDTRNSNLDIFYDTPQNAPPLAPDLVSPGNDTWATTGTPTFTWTFKDINASDTQSAYQVQLDNSSSFSSVDYDSGAVVSSTASHAPASAIADGIYHWRARTRDNGGLWGPYSSSRVIKIDTVAPSAAAPVDAGNWSTSSTVNWSWTPSSDGTSGVAGYYVCIGTSAGASDIVSDQWTPAPNFTMSLGTNGTTYYAKVKAVDNATNAGSYGGDSDGITVDVSIPSASTPQDDGQYTNSSLVKWTWTGSTDYPSGIAGYYVSVGSAPGQEDITKESWSTTASYTYAAGMNGVTYYLKLKAKDSAGNVGDYGGNSDGITVDTSVPTTYTPVDNGTYSNITTLYWSWPPSWDSPSGISGYYVSVGTSYGGNDTVDGCFTSATDLTLTGAADGKTYYCRVFAVDNAGNTGPFSASSDGITVDTTVPSDITVTDDGPYTRTNTSLHAGWTSSFDEVSGIADYKYCIGTAAGAGDVVPWTSAGQALSATRRSLTLQNGVTYYISVKARNGAGLWSGVSTSEGVTVDVSVPSAGTPASPGNYSLLSSITWNWTASSDLPSGIRGYYVSIGSVAGGEDVVKDAFVSDNFYTFAPAANGRTYYAKVKAQDNAGNTGGYGGSSTGVLVDISIPQVATPTDGGAFSTGTSLTFDWTAAEDAPSGVAGYFLSIGTSPGGSDVLKDMWTTGLAYTMSGAVGGRAYYAMVKAQDNAGNTGAYSAPSDGITVDTTAPSPVAVYAGGYLRNATSLELSWSISYDPETPVVEYMYALGTSPGASDVVAWTGAGLRISLSLTQLNLMNGITYYASVRARNAAGLLGDASTGAGLTVDLIAPAASTPAAQGAFINRSVVSWVWNESADPESGIAGYYVFIGTAPGGSDVVNGAWTSNSTFSFIGGINGVRYYASVAAQDRAGNLGPRSPPGAAVTVDTSLPAAYPPVADARYSMYPALGWRWTPSQDSPSGIAGYYVSVGTFPGGDDIVRDFWTVSPGYNFSGGQDGKTYYIKVRARDNAGNLGDYVTGTDGVTVDLQAPAGRVVIEGGAAYTARRAVMLALYTNDTDVSEMQIGSDQGLSGIAWEPYAQARGWVLSEGDGDKTVYARFRDRAGQVSGIVAAIIRLDTSVAPFRLDSSSGPETGDQSTTISSTVEPGSRVFVNGNQVQVGTDGSFKYGVQLQEGSNVIVVTVLDPAGNGQTVTKSIWRTPGLGSGAGGDSTLILLLAIIAIILVIVVLAVSLSTRRVLMAHLGSAQAPAAKEERPPAEAGELPSDEEEKRPPAQNAQKVKKPRKEAAGSERTEEAAQQAPAGETQGTAADGWEERPATEGAPSAGEQQPETVQMGQETPESLIEALAAATRGPGDDGVAAPREAGRPQAPPYYRPREGDVFIRADGTEAAGPEPRLVSEWSPDTGQWTPVAEERPEPPVESPSTEQQGIEEGPGEMAPEPTRALEDLVRSVHARDGMQDRSAGARETQPPPLPSATPSQRRSAKEIYAALYGKKAIPPTLAGAAAAAPAKAPAAGGQAAAPAAPPAEERKVIGKARCAQCKGVIPIYSAERPLKIKCPTCGLEGMIK